MGCKISLLLMKLALGILLLFLSERVATVSADAVVTGTAFCDQCRDGGRSLFDYPLYGARVAVKCGGGAMTAYKEESTNWFGGYTVRFQGSPDLSRCYARVVSGPARCGASAGPAKELRLVFRFWGMETFMVDPLVAQPAEPMRLCPHGPAPPTVPGYMPPRLPPPTNPPPTWTPPAVPVLPPPAPWLHPPPLPFLDASACTYDKWMKPEFKCYWKVVRPDTTVALAFGPVAAGKYGPEMTLWEGLQGRGDLYRTLLREGTTSLLNSYNTLGFCYPTLRVINLMNWALLGSSHDALETALRFRRANSGSSGDFKASCSFSSCS